MMNIFLKTYCQSSDIKIADEFSHLIKENLNDMCTVAVFKIEEYWKIEGFFEVSFDLHTTKSVTEILDRLASGWEKTGQDYIWNTGENTSFISEIVRWAQLEIIS